METKNNIWTDNSFLLVRQFNCKKKQKQTDINIKMKKKKKEKKKKVLTQKCSVLVDLFKSDSPPQLECLTYTKGLKSKSYNSLVN